MRANAGFTLLELMIAVVVGLPELSELCGAWLSCRGSYCATSARES